MSRRLHRGLLVAIEGIDGAGKTTQVQRLRQRFVALGFDVVASKEPTDGPWGRRIRASATEGRMDPEEELAAFLADRREHVAGVIQPALERCSLVLLDRYYFSTIAYQGIRGADPAAIQAANEAFAPVPDLLVVLDIDPEVSLGRIEGRGDSANHFERVHLLEASRAIFRRYAQAATRRSPDGRRCWSLGLDASLPADEVTESIASRILQVATEAIAADRALSPEAQLEATMAVFGSSIVSHGQG